MHEILDGHGSEYPLHGNILIAGTSTDGPTLYPRRMYNLREAIELYGSGELIVGCHEALLSGATSIHLLRISGVPATVTLVDSNLNPLLEIKTTSSGTRYNSWKIIVTSTHINVINDQDIIIRSYDKSNFTTVGELAAKIKMDASVSTHMILAQPTNNSALVTDIAEATYELSGSISEDALMHSERASKLNAAYNVILNLLMDIDIIVPMRAYPDLHIDIRNDLIKLCHNRAAHGYGTMAVLPLYHLNTTNSLITTNGRYLSVAAMRPILYRANLNPEDINTLDTEYYISTGEALYAGLLSRLDINQYTDNKTLPIIGDHHSLTRTGLNQLDSLGYTTLRRSTTRGYVVSKGQTIDHNQNFRSIYSTRMCIFIENMLRRHLDVYIGEPTPQVFEIEHKIDDFMQDLMDSKAIRYYSFDLSISLDTLNVEIEFVPTHSIETIHASLRLITRR